MKYFSQALKDASRHKIGDRRGDGVFVVGGGALEPEHWRPSSRSFRRRSTDSRCSRGISSELIVPTSELGDLSRRSCRTRRQLAAAKSGGTACPGVAREKAERADHQDEAYRRWASKIQPLFERWMPSDTVLDSRAGRLRRRRSDCPQATPGGDESTARVVRVAKHRPRRPQPDLQQGAGARSSQVQLAGNQRLHRSHHAHDRHAGDRASPLSTAAPSPSRCGSSFA